MTPDRRPLQARWLTVGAVIWTVSCGGSGLDAPVIDRAVAVQSEAANLTFEEAGFLASGALIDIYGLDADPVPVSVEGDIVEYQGQRVWRLGVSVEVDEDLQRDVHVWRLWVGTPPDGPPAVLRAQRRS